VLLKLCTLVYIGGDFSIRAGKYDFFENYQIHFNVYEMLGKYIVLSQADNSILSGTHLTKSTTALPVLIIHNFPIATLDLHNA